MLFRNVPFVGHDREDSSLIGNASPVFEQLSPTEIRRLREGLLDAALDDVSSDSAQLDRVEIVERLLGVDLCRKLGIFRLPDGFKLSVVMPVYNEIRTLAQVIERVRSTQLPLEIVIVDDGSRDG